MKHILLFPGGFKPFHDGHLSILESYISNIDNVNIDEIRIYISPKDRENITADSTIQFLDLIKYNIEKKYGIVLTVSISDYPSPIRKCYDDVNNSASDELFCMVSSDKDNDIKRKDDFYKQYQPDGKYYDEEKGVKTFNINVNITPIKYCDRIDFASNEYVSATIVRTDLRSHNYEMFRKSYEYMLKNNIISEKNLDFYYQNLLQII